MKLITLILLTSCTVKSYPTKTDYYRAKMKTYEARYKQTGKLFFYNLAMKYCDSLEQVK